MSIANVNYLYSNYQFLKVFNFVSFFFPSKLFLIHTVAVEQSLGGVVTIIVKYLYLPSFFKKTKLKANDTTADLKVSQFESVLLKGIAHITGSKTIVVCCFNMKKIHALRVKRITRAIEFSDFKYSAFCHAISNQVLALLVFSNSGARLLAEYIKLELRSSRNHNSFISFLKNFLLFLLILVKKRSASRIVGVRVLLSGRFNGHNRARSKQIRVGVIGLQSTKHFVDYYSVPCFTKYGTFGIKVWLNYE
jgi:hypothetical protein